MHVSIGDEPIILSGEFEMNKDGRDFGDIIKWIKLHKEVLLQHWNHQLTDREVLNKLGTNIETYCSKETEGNLK